MHLRKTLTSMVLCAVMGTLSVASAVSPAGGDVERGQRLHELRCTGCHVKQFGGDGSGVYLRNPRRVKDMQELIKFSTRLKHYNRTLDPSIQLSALDLGDIVAYVNRNYYHFY